MKNLVVYLNKLKFLLVWLNKFLGQMQIIKLFYVTHHMRIEGGLQKRYIASHAWRRD